MTTMRAAVLHGQGDLRIEDVPVPEPAAGEVLLRVRAVGVCGTDAAEYADGPTMFPIEAAHPTTGHHGPMVIGHEFAGEVAEVGTGVDQSWVGRLVASCGAIPCADCRQCRAGRTNQCQRYAAVGLHRDGAAAEFVTTPAANCEPVEALGLGADAAALGQPMSIAVHAVQRSRLVPGERVVVIGAGGIGAFLTFVVAERGCNVVVVEPDERRRETADALGAIAVAPDEAADVAAVLGDAPDVVFEVSGSAGGLKEGIGMLPAGGRVVMVGMQKQPARMDLRLATLREHELIGTNAMVREQDFNEALRLVAAREHGWHDIAPVALPLEQVAAAALARIAEGDAPAIKVMIDPTGSEPRPTDTIPRARRSASERSS